MISRVIGSCTPSQTWHPGGGPRPQPSEERSVDSKRGQLTVVPAERVDGEELAVSERVRAEGIGRRAEKRSPPVRGKKDSSGIREPETGELKKLLPGSCRTSMQPSRRLTIQYSDAMPEEGAPPGTSVGRCQRRFDSSQMSVDHGPDRTARTSAGSAWPRHRRPWLRSPRTTRGTGRGCWCRSWPTNGRTRASARRSDRLVRTFSGSPPDQELVALTPRPRAIRGLPRATRRGP
jgi:hypothetical protein